MSDDHDSYVMSEELKFKVGDQWYYRGNRSPAWFALAERLDGSASGISEKLPSLLWPFLEVMAELNTKAERYRAALENMPTKHRDECFVKNELGNFVLTRCHQDCWEHMRQEALHPTQPAEGRET